MTLAGSPDLAQALAAPAPETPFRLRSMLVATDGTDASIGAVRLARALEQRTGATVHVISVCDGSADPAARATAVDAQLTQVLGADHGSTFVVRTGSPSREIAEQAHSMEADLIVTGRGRNGFIERLSGEVHLRRLLRVTPCPVLAVDPMLARPARRLVIGIDFSAHSVAMARTAIAIADPEAAIYLVHVKPDPPFGLPHPGQWLTSYDDGVRAGLSSVRESLDLPVTHLVEPIVVHGHPGVALGAFALLIGADLLAVGAQGSGFLDRVAIGRVSGWLIGEVQCSLLAVPSCVRHHRG